MHIKEIKINGFKSYKEDTSISDIEDGLNIIVGRNGSGKSNIFSAIEFALTLEYNKYMKPEERDALIYKGQKRQESAFVEIVFDNSDKKLPVDDNAVTFRRVIGTKKDKFLVNGRELSHAKKFLDAAGFTNPYFIVKQGKVLDLALASDSARLKVISDVTGANAYDTKIAECRRMIQEADDNRKEIEERLMELKQRKDLLEKEVGEQKRFVKSDQSKRAIEFLLHGRKMQDIERNITALETSRNEYADRLKPTRDDLERLGRNIQLLQRDIAESELRTKQLQDLKSDYEASKNNVAAILACRNQELSDIKNKALDFNQQFSTACTIEKEIQSHEELLAKSEDELSRSKKRMDELFFRKCQLDNRVTQCREKSDSDKTKGGNRRSIENKIKEITKAIAENRQSLNLQGETRQKLEEECQREMLMLEKLRRDYTQYVNELNKVHQSMEKSRIEQHKVKSRMEIVSRQSCEKDQIACQKRVRLTRLEEEWKKCLGLELFQGYQGVHKILDDWKAAGIHQEIINGYFGLVCEIINCDSKLDTAIEVAIGRRLAHHVVQSKWVAEVILKEFNARKIDGEVHFIPIDGLKRKILTQLSDLKGAKPLISLIEFPTDFTSVAEFTFGNTLLCDTFETATETMRLHRVQCVTLEGNQVSKVGVMTGGYRSRRPQKLEVQRAKCIDENELQALIVEKQKLDEEHNLLKQDFEQWRLEYSRSDLKRARMQEKKRLLIRDIETAEKKVAAIKESIRTIDKIMVDLKATISISEEREKSLRNDSGTSGDKIQTSKDFRIVGGQYSKADEDYHLKLKERNALDGKLKLLRKKFYTLMEISIQTGGEAVNEKDEERILEETKSLSIQNNELQKKIDKTNRDLAQLQKLVLEKQGSADKLTDQKNKAEEQLRHYCNELDSFTTNYANWLKKLDELKAEGKQLGSVPPDVERFEKLKNAELYQKLRKLNTKLKNSAKIGINQEAIQQYDELKEKYDTFENRRNRCSEDKKHLIEFLKDLGAKKAEAMLRNIRLVQNQFQKIFCTIVPQGNAELIFYGNDVCVDHDRNIEDVELRDAVGDNVFEGVKIGVNFVGKRIHTSRSLAPLSGGQKSVLALCLILAIQTIDPAPFYIFDEVDQALDAAYRDAVARLIRQMSEQSQFICTTFRSELINVADNIYGVTFENRCSHIRRIEQTQALCFVENNYNTMDSNSISPNGSYCHNDSAA